MFHTFTFFHVVLDFVLMPPTVQYVLKALKFQLIISKSYKNNNMTQTSYRNFGRVSLINWTYLTCRGPGYSKLSTSQQSQHKCINFTTTPQSISPQLHNYFMKSFLTYVFNIGLISKSRLDAAAESKKYTVFFSGEITRNIQWLLRIMNV